VAPVKIAVISLARDRLDYSRVCFESLRNNAGTDYDHYVLDNGSTDGTSQWLQAESRASRLHDVTYRRDNAGISRGLNSLLDRLDPAVYDVIVKFDNDCEVVTPNTLRDIAALTHKYGLLLSPEIHGLRNPPATIGGTPLSLGGQLVDEKAQIGGIFLAAPASLYESFRYSESNPTWGQDDVEVCAHWRRQGGKCGYVRGYVANHYLTTDGQWADQPAYFDRKQEEAGAYA
jgi:glycosyltransferase involved in cell wall biosynthesis